MANPGNSNTQFLAIAAPVFTLISALASLYFMAVAGHRQQSIFLILAFTLWLLAPFAGLFWINRRSFTWLPGRRNVLHWFMVILSIGSVIVYGLGLRPHNAKPAFTFLVVPGLSWGIIIALLFLLRKPSGFK